MNQSIHSNFVLTLSILVLASSVSIISTDIYTPSLPHMPAYFHTNARMVQLTISLNVLMFGIGQLFHGSLSDRFGRKPVLLTAILLFTVFSFICTLAQNIEQLIIMRMLQGFMGAAEAVICMAIFKDLFDEKQQVRALAIFGMSVALAPAIGPILGGYIHVWFGWKFNFYLVGILGIITTLLIWRLLPESHTPDPHATKLSTVLNNYSLLLTDRKFLAYAALLGLSMGMIYILIIGSPFILIQQLAVPTRDFGYYQAIIVIAYFFGSLISTRAVDYIDTNKLLNIGLGIVFIGGICFIIIVAANLVSPNTFTVSFSIITLGLGPVFAVVPAKAILATNVSAGAAASMLGAIEMSIAGMAAGMLSLLYDGTSWPAAITVGMVLVVTLFVIYSISVNTKMRY